MVPRDEPLPRAGSPACRRSLRAVLALVAVVAFLAGCVPGASETPATGSPASDDRPRVPWEGGPQYYSAFPQMRDAGWTDSGFFPIGAWFHAVISQADVGLDKSVGINTYVEIADYSDMALVRSNR